MFRFDGEKWLPFKKKITYTQSCEYYTDDDSMPDLPSAKSENITLNDEQLGRLEKVKSIEDMGIESLARYVLNGEVSNDYPQMKSEIVKENEKETLLSMIDIVKATPEQLMTIAPLIKIWDDKSYYTLGKLVYHKGVIYKILQSHQGQLDRKPGIAQSLFAKVLTDPTGISILTWVQPLSTNPYKLGDKVTHKRKTWESMNNNNTWEPGAIGVDDRIWKEVKS